MMQQTIKARAKLFLSSADVEGLFGEGKWTLLDAIRREGSIQKGAQSLGRSYRKAWGDLKRAEQGLGRQLVIKTRGGRGGGTASLTPFAEDLLEAWESHRSFVLDKVRESYDRHLRPCLDQTSSDHAVGRRQEQSPASDRPGQVVLGATGERDGRRMLSCARAFAVAAENNLPIGDVARICNQHNIKIASCQLGCFK